MLVPRTPAFGVKLEVPRGAGSALLALTGAIAAAIAATVLSSGRIGSDQHGTLTLASSTDARSAAYVVPLREGGLHQDVVYAYDGEHAAPREITRFTVPDFPGTHARGAASPRGETLAIVWSHGAPATYATLTLVDVASTSRFTVEVASGAELGVDPLTEFAWAQFPAGARLAVSASAPAAEAPFVDVTIYEIDAATKLVSPRLTVGKVRSASPVGYSADHRSLYFVTIDQRGSILWEDTAGEQTQLAVLSPGRTTGWRLDPTSSQLAFVDLLGAGDRSAAGRTLILATGVIVSTETPADPLSLAWRPGHLTPDFGGIGGGTLSIDGQAGVSLMPVAWSGDGQRLAAVTVTVTEGEPGRALELILARATGSARVLLSRDPNATLLGFVSGPGGTD